MPLDIDNFEVLDPLGVSTEGTTLTQDKSYVEVVFNAVPTRYSSLAIKFRENDVYPFTIVEQFQYLRYATGGQTNPTIYHAVKEGATKEQEAYNYYMALIGGGHVNDEGDIAHEGIKALFTVSYISGSNKVTITAVNECVKFEDFLSNPAITVNIFNQDCTSQLPPLTATDTVSTSGNPCSKITVELTSSELLVQILDPIEVIPNTDNPFVFDIPRGVPTVFQGKDINGRLLSKTYVGPPILDANKFYLSITNGSNSAKVVVGNTMEVGAMYPLRFFYKLDDLLWTKGTTFDIILGGAHTMHIKDNYGCEVSIAFTISPFQVQTGDTIEKTFCGDLHELNVGKYLNLFGKQHTMKLGFVCNAEPNTVKIFKHIQMILSIDYAIKNVSIRTSLKQERFIPGNHMTYRIREGMHSVPLKNPRDWDDLRGTWAYIELEIESINNSKVDLFSVIMHLRKSTI